MHILNFTRNYHFIFSRCFANFHSKPRAGVFSNSTLSLSFFIFNQHLECLSIFVWAKWYLDVVICIFLITGDIKYILNVLIGFTFLTDWWGFIDNMDNLDCFKTGLSFSATKQQRYIFLQYLFNVSVFSFSLWGIFLLWY